LNDYVHMAMRANFARQQMEEARRAAEAKERNVKLLLDCHKRISHSTPQWGDRDLLQRISEEVMEAGK
jgi:nitrate/TMAO reductase-like tetraheme cytochrome c subunit